jgi:opacity protein-like surface antigen
VLRDFKSHPEQFTFERFSFDSATRRDLPARECNPADSGRNKEEENLVQKSRFLKLGLASAALVLAALPQVASAEPFSGEYLGLQAGVVMLDLDRITLAGPVNDSATEPTGSLIFGYRTPISERSPIVLGIEGELGAVSEDINARFGVSGIAGFKIGKSALAYGRVGYVSLSDLDPQSNSDEALSLGGGVEFNLTDRLNLRADYRYEDFGTVVRQIDNIVDVKAHEVTAGLIYNF